MITIRKYREEDKEQIWQIIKHVISTGDTFNNAPDTPREKMLAIWCSAENHTYVAVSEDRVVGTFFIKENQSDLGSHVANAGYMVAPEARGKGVGRKMGEFSLEEAKRLGFRAMRFNSVVKSNGKAVKFWQSLGFEIVGEVPESFNHITNGLTNTYIMYRKL